MSRSLRSGADGGRSPRKPARSLSATARNIFFNSSKLIKRRRSQAVFRTHSEIWLVSDHPVRSSNDASRYLFDVAATPPLGGGEYHVRTTLVAAAPRCDCVNSYQGCKS